MWTYTAGIHLDFPVLDSEEPRRRIPANRVVDYGCTGKVSLLWRSVFSDSLMSPTLSPSSSTLSGVCLGLIHSSLSV